MNTARVQIDASHALAQPEELQQRLSLQRVELPIGGLSGAGAAQPLAARLQRLAGVREAVVNPVTARAAVAFDPGLTGVESVVRALEAEGIEVGRSVARWYLRVPGLECPSCTRGLEAAVEAVPGVHSATVNLATDSLTVEYSPRRTDIMMVRDAVLSAGFRIGVTDMPTDRSAREDEERSEFRTLLRKFIVATVVALATVPLSYPGLIDLGEIVAPGSAGGRAVLAIVGLLTLIVMGYSGGHFYRGLWSAFRNRIADMNTLVALSISAAWLYSVAAVIEPSLLSGPDSPRLFFQVPTAVIALVLLGQLLETREKRRSSDPTGRLSEWQPKTASVLRQERPVELPLEEVLTGDIVIVRPGDRIPADGTVVEGASLVDESPLIGESRPVAKGRGDTVLASTINKTGSLTFRVTAAGKETTVNQVRRIVRGAEGSKVRIQRIAELVSGHVTLGAIVLSIAGFMVWYNFGPQPAALYAVAAFVTVLVAASPRAFGLATGAPMAVGLCRGLASGIIFRSACALEAAHRVRTIVLNKSGTITTGEPRVSDVLSLKGDRSNLVRLAASVEACSSHPFATAILSMAHAEGVALSTPTEFKAIPARGVEGMVNGQWILVGNRRMMLERHIDIQELTDAADRMADECKSCVFVAVDGSILGMVALEDSVREDAVSAVAAMKKMGLKVWMITGDDHRTAAALGDKLGVQGVISEADAETKVKEVRRLRSAATPVAVIGEGIADGTPLAEAGLGIAIGRNAHVEVGGSDITLLKARLMDAAAAIRMGRTTMRVVKQNLAFAVLYNILAIPVALGLLYPAFGITVSPIIAAAAMAVTPVAILTNANQLLRCGSDEA